MPWRPKRKLIEIQVDGKRVGKALIGSNASERQKVLAACKIPGVLSLLRKKGVASTWWDSRVYNILTKPVSSADYPIPSDSPVLEAPDVRIVKSPFRGLGITSAFADRPIL